MHKLAMTLVLVVVLLLVGCSQPLVIPPTPNTTKSETNTESVSPPSIPETEARLVNQVWISPAEIKIANFYAGARAEWNLRLHNGNDASTQTEKYEVITDIGETVADLSIKKPLADGNIANASITSDNPKDMLMLLFYNPSAKSLNVAGLVPDAKRVVTITYTAWTQFFVSYMQTDTVREGYSLAPEDAKDWVIIADMTPVLAPKETREITVALDIPSNVDIVPMPALYVSDSGKKELAQLRSVVKLQPEIGPEFKLLSSLDGKGTSSESIMGFNIFKENNRQNTELLITSLIKSGYISLSNPKQWEFWTVAGELSTGQIQTQMATRWCVALR